MRCTKYNLIADRHPLKQGLKLHDFSHALPILWGIADRHPLKQGLKHSSEKYITRTIYDRRPTSIKTRIETA